MKTFLTICWLTIDPARKKSSSYLYKVATRIQIDARLCTNLNV